MGLVPLYGPYKNINNIIIIKMQWLYTMMYVYVVLMYFIVCGVMLNPEQVVFVMILFSLS